MEAREITRRGRSTGNGEIKGERKDEMDGRGGEETKGSGMGGEATEEKTRLHVTSSLEPIWSQSVFHYQKPHRLYTKLYIRGDPCKTHRDLTDARALELRDDA
ncbi:unnamed protein product [Lasius platythorax]|uniref:Uncharacterized protein n=1 Tax=Lasius platythorax TaxID=488582 RepID=A0AAV2NN37_9HYME